MITAAAERVRWRVRVTGVVQGVGFRPFVHRLAGELALAGHVGNDSNGVFVEIEGDAAAVDVFLSRIQRDAPPLALIESVGGEVIPTRGETTFEIVESAAGTGARTLVPPDVAVCDECLAEVLDPADRRHRYPFANCTNCGPRFTIIGDLPYDRTATSMAEFPMCAACAAEYRDPADRRYHAQPVACALCGPSIAFELANSVVRGTDAVIALFHKAIEAGQIIAVKGLGGYHLACDAASVAAVAALRERKGRNDKPFAVMVADLETARGLARIDDAEAAALTSPARPIVLLRRLTGSSLSELVAPGNPLIGVMLPYTPLHHLLFRPIPGEATLVPSALVLTSGNLSNEPICTDDAEARQRLALLADAFLTHDRRIEAPCDDSVIRVIDGEVQPVRRSRGFAPIPVRLAVEVAPTLAVGGELKNTFCLAAGHHAWVSQHVGDMENLETLAAFERGVESFRRMYAIEEMVVATDGHPAYLTRRWALAHAVGKRLVEVQHHHAHIASVMAEHGLDGSSPVLGFAFDGTGFGIGDDGKPEIWGGEVLLADYRGFQRLGHLRPLPLPGGDGAVQNPCRIAIAYLAALGIETHATDPSAAACDPTELAVVRRQVERNVGCVPTTSMGRLFDAVASILGVRHRISYEAQAAIELETLAEQGIHDAGLQWRFTVGDGTIDPEPVLRGILGDLRSGTATATIAYDFHRAVAAVVVEMAKATPHTIALSGGVFQNALLARLTRLGLEQDGHHVITHHLVPPNDGGLSLGQAVIAGLAGQPRS